MRDGGELILEEGGTFDNSNVDFNDSVFKPTGAVSVTNSGFNLHGTSSVVLQGDTTFSQSGDIYWPRLDLGGNSLTLDSNDSSITVDEALNIANGESLISGASRLNLNNTLVIEDGGELIFGTGDVTLMAPLTLNGELALAGGTFKVNESSTVSGMVSIAGNSSIDVLGGKSVIFSYGEINTQNYELTLNNSGTVSFPQNSSGIVLNNADGLLKLQGTGTVQELSLIHI